MDNEDKGLCPFCCSSALISIPERLPEEAQRCTVCGWETGVDVVGALLKVFDICCCEEKD